MNKHMKKEFFCREDGSRYRRTAATSAPTSQWYIQLHHQHVSNSCIRWSYDVLQYYIYVYL